MRVDLDRRELTPITGVPLEERGPDFGSSGKYAMARRGGMLQAVSLADGKRSEPFPADRFTISVWAPGDSQLALVGDDQIAVWSPTASRPPAVVRLRVPSPFGLTTTTWLDDHTLLFTGESSPDAGEGIWMVHVRDGQPVDDPALAFLAPRGVAYTLIGSANGRVLAGRAAMSQALVRITKGGSTVVREAPELYGLIQIDPTGTHALALSAHGVIVIDLASSANLAINAPAFGWASFDGNRMLSATDHHLVEMRGTSRRSLATLPNGARIMCATRAKGKCAVWWDSDNDGIDVALLEGDQLGPARHVTIQGGPWRPEATVSISPDGGRIALSGFADRVEVMDPATGAVEVRKLPDLDRCISSQFSAWGPRDELYVITPARCNERASHIYLLPASGEPSTVFETDDWFTGIATAPDGTLYATIERSRAELVMIDRL
jgi:hypothetical protein